jgi:hypothetical protein
MIQVNEPKKAQPESKQDDPEQSKRFRDAAKAAETEAGAKAFKAVVKPRKNKGS